MNFLPQMSILYISENQQKERMLLSCILVQVSSVRGPAAAVR